MNRYMAVGTDAGLPGRKVTDTEPPGWSAANRTSREEVMQTLLGYHLAELTGVQMDLVFRAADYWGGPDLAAIDESGRLHVFELKKTTIGASVLAQMSGYIAALEAHKKGWAADSEGRESAERVALYLAGAWADKSTYNLEGAVVAASAGLDEAKQAVWRARSTRQALLRKTPSEYYRDATTALLNVAADPDPVRTPPKLHQLCEHSAVVAARLKEIARAGRVRGTGGQPTVWLSGPDFTAEVIDAVRDASNPIVAAWCAQGVEVRLLDVEVRLAPGAEGWFIRGRLRAQSPPEYQRRS